MSENPRDNVIPLKKNEKERKLSKAQKARNYLAAMRILSFPPWDVVFPRLFKTLMDEEGNRLVVEVATGDVCHRRAKDMVVNELIDYSRQKLVAKNHEELELSPDDASTIAKVWLATDNQIDQSLIKPVRQMSEPGYCWQRLPFDLAEGPTPTWDEIMGRMTNHEAYMAFVGSLLVDTDERQQYVWIYGDGLNSKGAMSRALRKVFGPSYKSETVPSRDDKFWTLNLIGARLVVFPDHKEDNKFVTSGLFKSLTGNDPIRYEVKGGAAGTTTLNCKFLFYSNDKPTISSSKADQRRAIFCEISPLAEGTVIEAQATYEARLWAEAPAWLWRCVETWERVTLNGLRVIPNSDEGVEHLEELADESEECYEIFFQKHFEKPTYPDATIDRDKCFVSLLDMQTCLDLEANKRLNKKEWKKWLKRKHDCEYKKVCLNKEKTKFTRRYVGIKATGKY